LKNFLRALWPHPPEGNLTVWLNPSKASLHKPLAEVLVATDADIAELHTLNVDQDVYFSLGLRADGLAPGKRGGKQDTVALPGWALDFDFAHPTAHKAQNLPTEADLSVLMGDTPDPSIVVRSGHGLHCYWVFERPWLLPTSSARTQAQLAYKAFWQPFADRSAARGWQLDNTASIERVWRLPGMINHKSGALVETVYDDGERYPLAAIAPSGARSAPKAARLATSATSPVNAPPVENATAPQDVLAALGRLSAANPNKAAVTLVLAGQSFVPRGERDSTLHRVCSLIAFLPESEPYDSEALAEVLRPSLMVWAGEDDATKDIEEELAKAVEKLDRAQHAKATRDEEEAQKFAGLIGLAAKSSPPGEPEPTPAQAVAFATQRAVIQVRTSFWVYDFGEDCYVGPKIKDEILTFARDAWSDARTPVVFSLDYTNAKGGLSAKTLPMVMREYGVVAKGVIGKLALDRSYYDGASSKFVEAICPQRVTEAAYSAEIDHWLGLLVGHRKEKLLDWIAAVPRLDEQCCALYLDGVSGAGKGLLASGLARLWTEGGPAALTNVLGNFNGDMFRCPLILLDEGLPKARGNVSADIRTLLGSPAHTLTEKYVVNRQVVGAVRLLIAANNPDVLSFGEENGTANDAEAYVNRFLHIEARREAADWLREHNVGGAMTKTWVAGDLIAKHCVWLSQHREIIRGKRFLVEGESADDMHRKLIMQGGVSGLICEWLARFSSNPDPLTRNGDKRVRPLALIGNGDVLINTQGLIDGWATYMKRDGREIPLPSATKVGAALTKLSGGRSKKLGSRLDRTTYHAIDFEMVASWSNTNQIGNEDKMRQNLKKPLVIDTADLMSDPSAIPTTS